jgi:pantoate--beta-alanine ligase
LSLFEKSLSGNDITICSIFINPTQFNDASDFLKYPVTLEQDLYRLEETGAQVVFLPGIEEIYPDGITHLRNFNLGNLENILEGKYRPEHFQGVCQVMSRLLTIVQPDNLYMGQKDYQQCMVVHRLLQLMHSDIVLKSCATQREDDGLAMSSRNMRLTADERKKAITISAVLKFFKENLQPGDLVPMVTKGKQMLEQSQFKTDYVEIADKDTLESVYYWDGKQQLVSLIAAFMNDVRLIDNMILNG